MMSLKLIKFIKSESNDCYEDEVWLGCDGGEGGSYCGGAAGETTEASVLQGQKTSSSNPCNGVSSRHLSQLLPT